MYFITHYACYLICMGCVYHAYRTHILCFTTNATATELISLIRRVDIQYFILHPPYLPIAVAARSKAWFRGSSLAGIAGSNPAGGMDVCLQAEISTSG
jgi:hypothetical protein